MDVFDFRLPRAVRAAVGAGAGAGRASSSRPPPCTGATGDTVHTDRGELRAPLIVDALGWRRVLSNATPNPAAERAPLARPGGAPAGGGEEMELWIDPRYIRAGYSWSFPARDEIRVGVGSFWPAITSRSQPCVWPAISDLPPRGLPGQLDSPPAARRHRGRRVLRRRLGRPLPAADRRGHSHRALLRPRLRRASCERCSTAHSTREQALPATAPSLTRTSGSSAGCCAASARSGSSPPPARSPRWRARSSAALSATGRSSTTCGSRRPRSWGRGPAPRRRSASGGGHA